MCFAPQRRAPSQLRTWRVLYILTWKCASRHNGVPLFISHLTRWLRARRFSEVTFRPSGATNHWKNTMNRDFPAFSRTCIFFLLTFSPLWSSHFFSYPLWLFPHLVFHLSILSEVWLLDFLRLRICKRHRTRACTQCLQERAHIGILSRLESEHRADIVWTSFT